MKTIDYMIDQRAVPQHVRGDAHKSRVRDIIARRFPDYMVSTDYGDCSQVLTNDNANAEAIEAFCNSLIGVVE